MYLQCIFINKHTNKNLWQLSFEKLEIVFFLANLLLLGKFWHYYIWTSIEIIIIKKSLLALCSILYRIAVEICKNVKARFMRLSVWSNFRVTSYLTRDVILRFNVGLVLSFSYWNCCIVRHVLLNSGGVFLLLTVFLFPIYSSSVLIGKWRTALSCSVVWWGEQQYQLFWPQA